MSFIIPAIDLKDGKCVQLEGGNPSKVLFSDSKPLDIAEKWAENFDILHVIDLDAALGTGDNMGLIQNISEIANSIQVGGGIRTIETACQTLSFADRLIIGTSRELLEPLSPDFGKQRLILAVDSRKGKVSTDGWRLERDDSPVEIAEQYRENVGSFLYTCIDLEGKQAGPDLETTSKITRVGSTIASGGVSSMEDIQKLDRIGVESIVIGSALYTEKLNLDEVIKYEKNRNKSKDQGD